MITAEKFLDQPMPRQLGALAVNLARIASCTRWDKPTDVILPMMTESKQFIEWIAPHTEPEIAVELVDIQVMLSLWQQLWPEGKHDKLQRALLHLLAKKWSDQVLGYSGLLDSA